MIKAFIIDDEQNSVDVLSTLITDYCHGIEIVGTTTDPQSAINKINTLKPELVFLDIKMSQMSGFELLEFFPFPSFKVIFTTAYSEYAIQSIKRNAFDYLLKPIRIEDLKNAVFRFIQWYNIENKKTIEKQKKKYALKIPIASESGHDLVSVEDIIWIEASESYSIFNLIGNKKIIASSNLKKFEEILDPNTFLRIHHSYIINILHLVKVIKNRKMFVVLDNGKELEVSQRKRQFISNALNIS